MSVLRSMSNSFSEICLVSRDFEGVLSSVRKCDQGVVSDFISLRIEVTAIFVTPEKRFGTVSVAHAAYWSVGCVSRNISVRNSFEFSVLYVVECILVVCTAAAVGNDDGFFIV